jgi:transaldolase
MHKGTLKAFADHGVIGPALAGGRRTAGAVLAQFAKTGIDIDSLAARLQDQGVESFARSWVELMAMIASKSKELALAG